MSVLHFLGDSPVDHVLHMASLCFPYPAVTFSYCFFPSVYFQAPQAGTISFILLSVRGSDMSSVFWCGLSGFLWGLCVFSDTLFLAG